MFTLFKIFKYLIITGCGFTSDNIDSALLNKKSGETIIFKTSFERPDELEAWESEQANQLSISRVLSPARTGKYSAKFTIAKKDPLVFGSYRSELKHSQLPVNAERWYGISIFLPDSYIVDQIPESIFQWHNVPNFKRGENWSRYKFQNPFRIETNNGRFVFVHQFSTISEDAGSPVASKSYDLGSYETGVWTDWVIHFKLSYKSDGIFEIWKNGKKLLSINGPNYYNDDSGPYFKMGIYKWGFPQSKLSERTLYIDEIKIGNETSTFRDVTPDPSP